MHANLSRSILTLAVSVAAVLLCSKTSHSQSLPQQALGGPLWSSFTHPCPGPNRTDTMHRDIDGTLWVGCGTNAAGYGVYRSDDGGAQWSAISVSPAGKLDLFRTVSLSRGHDGALYAGGTNAQQGDNDIVVRIDTSSPEPYPVTPTLTAVAVVGYSFLVGTYKDLGDGRALAESQNGTDLLYRPSAATGATATDWQRIEGFPQIVDLVAYAGAFYGSGSTISTAPKLFLPPTTPGAAPHAFVVLDLQGPTGWTGELWGLAVNGRRLVSVGVNQSDNIGTIFVSNGDLYNAGNYTEFSMSAITGDVRTWARGVCMRGDRIVVVGERQPLSTATGRVLISDDGGQSFQNITPAGVSSTVGECVIEPDGTVVVAGSGGYVGIRHDPDWIFTYDFEG